MSQPWRLHLQLHPFVAGALWATQDFSLAMEINGQPAGQFKVSMVTYHTENDADVDLVQVTN